MVISGQGGKYEFLPLTVCRINILVMTSLVSYSNGVINTTVINSTSLGSDNTNLTQFLADIVNYQSWSMQDLTTNSFGDALYSIYVSSSGGNSSNSDMTNLILREMVSLLPLIYCPTKRTSTVSGTILAGCHRVLRNGTSFFQFHPVKPNEP